MSCERVRLLYKGRETMYLNMEMQNKEIAEPPPNSDLHDMGEKEQLQMRGLQEKQNSWWRARFQ